MTAGERISRVVLIVLFVAGCSQQSLQLREPVAAIISKMQRADYEGNREALRRHYAALAPFADDQEFGAIVSYWRGFALWRRALNGFNEAADPRELTQDLEHAIEEFNAGLAMDPNLLDAKIGAISCLFNLVFLHGNDTERVRELLARALPLLDEARAADPDNPRLGWVLGSIQWHNPPERGGGQEQAIATYRQALIAARERNISPADVLTPSWGEPELLMNLAWARLNQRPPHVCAAEIYAMQALTLVPYWHYVRDILLPQIRDSKQARECAIG